MGYATSLFNLMRNIGGSIGIATTGTMLARRRQAFGSLLGEHVSIFDPATNQVLAQLKAAFLARSGDAVAATNQAYIALNGMVQRQAAMVAFVMIFRVLHLAGSVRLWQFLRPPVAHEPASGRRFEIAPANDRKDNLCESAGRQVRPLAGQFLDELLEPRIVPDDHHSVGVLPHGSQYREDVGRASKIEMRVQPDFSRIASRFGHRFSRQARAHRVGADDKIGYQSVLPHQLSHPRGVPPSALIQPSLMIITRRIVPARLRVPENQ
jgi:hypothetical protein